MGAGERGAGGSGEEWERAGESGSGRPCVCAFWGALRRKGGRGWERESAGRAGERARESGVDNPSVGLLPRRDTVSRSRTCASVRECPEQWGIPKFASGKEPTSSRQGGLVCGALRLPHALIRLPLLFPQNSLRDFCGNPEIIPQSFCAAKDLGKEVTPFAPLGHLPQGGRQGNGRAAVRFAFFWGPLGGRVGAGYELCGEEMTPSAALRMGAGFAQGENRRFR